MTGLEIFGWYLIAVGAGIILLCAVAMRDRNYRNHKPKDQL